MLNGLVFDRSEYEAMREHEQLRTRWGALYGTIGGYEDWYQEYDLARLRFRWSLSYPLGDVLRDIACMN